jgi:hypothetical protein
VTFLRRFFLRLSNFGTGRRADERLGEEMAEQGLPLAENFLLDLRYAFRMLHRSPGFSVIATAIYSVIAATLLEETAVGDRAALPLGHGKDDLKMLPLIREGQDMQSRQPPLIDTAIVSPEYFHVLGMTLLHGRLFVDQDLEATPSIAVINRAAARTYWPGKDGKGEDPVGKRVRLTAAKPDWTTIVGVIADARTESLADAGIPQVYLDIYQRPAKFLAFYLRRQVDPAAIAASCVPALRAMRLDPVTTLHAE